MTTIKCSLTKLPTTCTQQVALLQQRGMQVDVAATAEFYLEHLNYYRLGAYWLEILRKRGSLMSASKSHTFIGLWRIEWMDIWDQDYVDMEVPGYIAFEKNGLGNFQFGLLHGQTDYRVNDNRVEFTWSGFDECDEVSGRGFAEIVQGELLGRIYIHLGDDSAFRAVKQSARKSKTA